MDSTPKTDWDENVHHADSLRGPLLSGRICSAIILVLGLAGLAGWLFDQPGLLTLWPTGSEMKFNTAVCLSLTGISLLLAFNRGRLSRTISLFVSTIVWLLAAATLFEYLFSWNLGLDEFVFKDTNMLGTTFAGRMAPQSGLTFLLLATGAFVLNCHTLAVRRIAHWAALGALLFPVQALIGYLLGHMNIVGLGSQSSFMALPTASAFIAGAIALLLRDPDRNLMESLTARTRASSIFRRLLVTSVLLPLFVGWFALHISGGKSHSAEYSVATIAFATTFLFVGLTWFNAARLNAAAHALAQREHLYSQLVENIPDVVFRLDRQFRHLYISPTVEKFSGLPPAQYLGKTIAETGVSLVLCELFEDACQKALDTLHEQAFEFEHSGRITLTRIIPVASGNEGETLLGLTSDITQRKLAEAAFRDTQDRLEATLAATQVATWTWDVPHDRVYADKNLARFFSVSVQDAAGGSIQRYLQAIHPEDRPRVEAAIIETLHNQLGKYEVDYRLVQSDNSIRWVTARGKVERDAAGKPLRFAGVVMDITDRKSFEEREGRLTVEAVNANVKFRAIFDQSSVFAGIMTIDGKLIEANQLSLEGCGYTAGQALGKFFWECPWWRGSTEVQDKIRSGSLLAAQGMTYCDTLPYHWADGSQHVVEFVLHPIRDNEGRIIFLHPTGADITERQRTEQALARARVELEETNQNLESTIAERTARLRETVQELEAFSYSIAHDMRAPLRAMVGFSTLLEEEYGPKFDDTSREYLQRIVASASRMDRLIVDILNYSKVVRGELDLSPVDVEKLTVEIIESYPALLQAESGITIAGPMPRILANEAALTQVISNILGNAVKFVAPGVQPRIRMWAQTPAAAGGETIPPGFVRLWFEDNGIGIPKESQAGLFKMFVRLHKPEIYEGTGIGLAIVKRAVERMGGTVGLESEPGHGTKIWVQLREATAPAPD